MTYIEVENYKKALLHLAHDMTDARRKGVTFIVGAGASQPPAGASQPTQVVPLASDLIKKLKRVFGDKLNKLLQDVGIDPQSASMEAFLSAYKKLTEDPDAPFKFLRKYLFDVNAAVHMRLPLGYVILAHFMKQDLVKHIISLNQDELLDRALFKLLGRHFRYVVSKSQFKHLQDQIEQFPETLDARMLLKPHGTIHLGATLRVELERTQRFEDDKKRALERVLEQKDVVLIGYSFNDGDMQDLILRMALEGRLNNFYAVSKSGNLFKNQKIQGLQELYSGDKFRNFYPIQIEKGSDKFFRELAKALYEPKSIFSGVDQGADQIDVNIANIIENINNTTSYYPRITEHRVRDIILCGIKEPTLENKIFIEILIIALKTRGKFKAGTLLESRWMKHLIKDYVKFQHTDTKADEVVELPLKKFLGQLQKMDIILSNSQTSQTWRPEGGAYYLVGRHEKEVIDNILKMMELNLGKDSKSKLRELMEKVIDEFDYDLIPDALYPNNFGFEKAKLIGDREQLKNLSIDIFTNSYEVFIIAETAEFLTKPQKFGIEEKDLQQKKIIVGISDPTEQPKESFHYQRSISVLESLMRMGIENLDVFFIPGEENCHHMTLGEKKGFYFYRKDKATRFCVIEVTGNDLEKLKNYYRNTYNNRKKYKTDVIRNLPENLQNLIMKMNNRNKTEDLMI